ncbi:unnamed protein product [Prorocentrum cordatum]|uniref:ATP-dependent DNA helicase n=1 Tax=Prorocentrum cordatum TaxID=2364126 RepID=A0ABN9SZ55_9DINO|nr:unnamed protein product [Polarella glacialis]
MGPPSVPSALSIISPHAASGSGRPWGQGTGTGRCSHRCPSSALVSPGLPGGALAATARSASESWSKRGWGEAQVILAEPASLCAPKVRFGAAVIDRPPPPADLEEGNGNETFEIRYLSDEERSYYVKSWLLMASLEEKNMSASALAFRNQRMYAGRSRFALGVFLEDRLQALATCEERADIGELKTPAGELLVRALAELARATKCRADFEPLKGTCAQIVGSGVHSSLADAQGAVLIEPGGQLVPSWGGGRVGAGAGVERLKAPAAAKEGEQYYLRLLLRSVSGSEATSWEHLARSTDDRAPPSFQGHARLLGLLADDAEALNALTEACRIVRSLSRICEMFAQFLVWMGINDKAAFWTSFLLLLSERHQTTDSSTAYRAVGEHLAMRGCFMSDFAVPPPSPNAAFPPAERAAQEYARELRSPEEICKEMDAFDSLSLNDDQQAIFDFARDRVDGCKGDAAADVTYIDGPAGRGETHVYKQILHYVRMTGRVALAVAMSGVAALLLPGGRTAHSRLPVPIPLEGYKANVKPQYAAARLIRDAAVIIWDEASTASRAMFEAVDSCLRERFHDQRPFGGKAVALGGDFRQAPPVLRCIGRDAVFSHTLAALPWWDSPHVRKFRLRRSARADLDYAFAAFCLRVGGGDCDGPPPPRVDAPLDVLAPPDWAPPAMMDWVYEGFDQAAPAQWHQCYAARAAVTPTNEAADYLDGLARERLPADAELAPRSRDAACAEVDRGDTCTPEMDGLDMQQQFIRNNLGPVRPDIAAAKNPMAELAYKAFSIVDKQMLSIVDLDCCDKLVLLGGIQVNTPDGFPDHFAPMRLRAWLA